MLEKQLAHRALTLPGLYHHLGMRESTRLFPRGAAGLPGVIHFSYGLSAVR